MRIRKADYGDIESIIKLLNQIAEIHYVGRPDLFKTKTSKFTIEELQEILIDEVYLVFVAEDDELGVIGYVFAIGKQYLNNNIMTDIKTLHIDDICVDESQRGKHIGEKLYNHVLDYAKKEDYYNVTLNVWSFNDDAFRFYEKRGLKPQKCVMEKIL